MNISGIRPGAGFYDYNTIKNDTAVKEQIEAAEINPLAREEKQKDGVQLAAQEISDSRTDTGGKDFAERYQPKASYELKGTESDIMSLDVEKAISDMKKDQVLSQYQFFVGETEAEELLAAAREQENFFL